MPLPAGSRRGSSQADACPVRCASGQPAWCRPADFLPSTPAAKVCTGCRRNSPRGPGAARKGPGGGAVPADRPRFRGRAMSDRPAGSPGDRRPMWQKGRGAGRRHSICAPAPRHSSYKNRSCRRCCGPGKAAQSRRLPPPPTPDWRHAALRRCSSALPSECSFSRRALRR